MLNQFLSRWRAETSGGYGWQFNEYTDRISIQLAGLQEGWPSAEENLLQEMEFTE